MLSPNERLTHEKANNLAWGKSRYWTPANKDALVARLAAYEDTGFTPEELRRLTRCERCEYCFELGEAGIPYRPGSGKGFYCSKHDVDFYAPFYDPAAYFCAEGKRREA